MMGFTTLENLERIVFQKKVADDVLSKLFPIDPYAICAGGAPRDWYFHQPASDIDIFMHSIHSMTTVEAMMRHVGTEITGYSDGENLPEWYKHNPHLHCVFNAVVGGEAIQIMLMNAPTFKSAVPNFPFSICKIWYKNGRITEDKEFTRSVRYNVLVKTGELYSDAHAYVKKIRAKFSSYRMFNSWSRAAEHIMNEGL